MHEKQTTTNILIVSLRNVIKNCKNAANSVICKINFTADAYSIDFSLLVKIQASVHWFMDLI